MAGDSSFDVVSDFDDQEMRNALDQVQREVQQRYDFKGVTYELTPSKTELVLLTDDEFRAKAIRELIESKAVKARSVPEGLRLGQDRTRRAATRSASTSLCVEVSTRT